MHLAKSSITLDSLTTFLAGTRAYMLERNIKGKFRNKVLSKSELKTFLNEN